ncbi:MAG: twin-arginine translocase subunit TatC [Tepidisphaeraceae bacterium]
MARPPEDPDAFRMTLGDHLEELRKRMIFGILGFAVAAALCLLFGKDVVSIFCRPLIDTLLKKEINPMLFINNVGDGFMVYLEISMISATVLASPWIVWQLWQFVAAGLYPNERKTITRYVPLSVTLLIAGDLFVYFFVLPLTLQFFMAFTLSIPMPEGATTVIAPTTMPSLLHVPSLAGSPENPPDMSLWFDSAQQRLKFAMDGKVHVIPFAPENLVAPQILLPDYIDLVMNTLIVFGLSFQLPLVVLALEKIGVVDVPSLKRMRRIVYFVMAVAACAIMPADAITAACGLMVPLCLLYELGIFLAARSAKAAKAALE